MCRLGMENQWWCVICTSTPFGDILQPLYTAPMARSRCIENQFKKEPETRWSCSEGLSCSSLLKFVIGITPRRLALEDKTEVQSWAVSGMWRLFCRPHQKLNQHLGPAVHWLQGSWSLYFDGTAFAACLRGEVVLNLHEMDSLGSTWLRQKGPPKALARGVLGPGLLLFPILSLACNQASSTQKSLSLEWAYLIPALCSENDSHAKHQNAQSNIPWLDGWRSCAMESQVWNLHNGQDHLEILSVLLPQNRRYEMLRFNVDGYAKKKPLAPDLQLWLRLLHKLRSSCRRPDWLVWAAWIWCIGPVVARSEAPDILVLLLHDLTPVGLSGGRPLVLCRVHTSCRLQQRANRLSIHSSSRHLFFSSFWLSKLLI